MSESPRAVPDPSAPTDAVGLHYDVHLMPRGRVNLRRWHWEIWHGATLLAAGWQLDPLRAQRSIRVHAVRYAHRARGLRVLHPDVDHPPETPWRNRRVSFTWGHIPIELIPLGDENRAARARSMLAG
ncbi:MAG TPA: hypothetical protein VFN48_03405 [Solirubrobacteraceae bacterium]|nr:hypothetical protein [Solirubrobacteraceae bacterium]